MTEAEWQTCGDPGELWRWMQDRVDWRKATRFCVACCRRAITSALPGEVAALVNLVEQTLTQGDGRFEGDLKPLLPRGGARESVVRASQRLEGEPLQRAARAALALANVRIHPSAFSVQSVFDNSAHAAPDPEEEYAVQSDLFRCVFQHPSRPVSFSPAWRTDTVTTLARQMYDSQDFSAMPNLADALQDAGCDNDDVLGHCRGTGPHVRGCRVVDAVFGKG
jgi:hypothetical protein